MKTSLNHLPGVKQKRPARFVQILREEFDEKRSLSTSERKKSGCILKIILYGSHTFGPKSRKEPKGWVEDRKSGYFSDYDLLVIVNDKEFTEFTDYWAAAQDYMVMVAMREGVPGLTPMPQVIVHSLQDVNNQLADGRYFFRDIIAEGIELYALTETKGGAKKYVLAEAKEPDEARAKEMPREYFNRYTPDARYSLELAEKAIGDEQNNHATFLLHQVTERAYAAYLLAKTLYSPATHDLTFLPSQCEAREETLRTTWSNENPTAAISNC